MMEGPLPFRVILGRGAPSRERCRWEARTFPLIVTAKPVLQVPPRFKQSPFSTRPPAGLQKKCVDPATTRRALAALSVSPSPPPHRRFPALILPRDFSFRPPPPPPATTPRLLSNTAPHLPPSR